MFFVVFLTVLLVDRSTYSGKGRLTLMNGQYSLVPIFVSSPILNRSLLIVLDFLYLIINILHIFTVFYILFVLF